MYSLGELLLKYDLLSADEGWDDVMYCTETDARLTFLTNKTQGYTFCYSYTVVTQGWLTIVYGGQEYTFHKNDLYIYSPGLSVVIKEASPDYRGICLIADEGMTLELPILRHFLLDDAQPIIELAEPILSLPAETAEQLHRHMLQLIHYQHTNHIYKREVMRHIYSAFLLDIQNARRQMGDRTQSSPRARELFFRFLRLLPQHFAEHHDIRFYADALYITPIYLSRIVRQVTGRTVVHFVNQYLLMEASYLLHTTNLSITQIADRLHFADAASFSKFFTRLKGVTPRSYRVVH